MYKYPYGNYSQLNLNWIINKIKALEDLIGSGGAGGADLTEVANALISASYSSLQAYQVNDIVYDTKTERLYRCNTAIPAGGEVWNPSHWDQILIGPTVANLVRAVAYMDSDHVFNESDVDGLHVTEALNALKTAVNSVADIAGNGVLTGFTATDLTGAANELKGAIEEKFGKYDFKLDATDNGWEQGSLSATGSAISSTTRIRSKFVDIPYDSTVYVKAASGYKISCRIYKGTEIGNGIYYADSSWVTENEYTIPTNCALRIVYSKSDDAAITPSDISTNTAPTITVFPNNMPAKKINRNKILFIGNSKSWDTSEYLAKVLGDLGYLNTEVICPYHGSISLQDHYDNRNSVYYEAYMCYTKNTYGWRSKTVVPLTQIISENPDITHVIFQQKTNDCDDPTTYDCLDDLIALFNGCNAIPKFYIEATWASDVTAFDTSTILNVTREVAKDNSKIQDVIPAGSCIEKLKSNSLFTDVQSAILEDGTHLNDGFPKTMAALSVIETLFGLDDKLYLSDPSNATYLINNLCFNIAKETKAYNTDIISVERGGTGAATTPTARKNLLALPSVVFTVPASGGIRYINNNGNQTFLILSIVSSRGAKNGILYATSASSTGHTYYAPSVIWQNDSTTFTDQITVEVDTTITRLKITNKTANVAVVAAQEINVDFLTHITVEET